MANALSALVSDSSGLFIMGHKSPDNDCGRRCRRVCHRPEEGGPRLYHPGGRLSPSKVLSDRLAQLTEYRGAFLAPQEALLMMDNRSLVVVVDTNRPEQVLSRRCWSPATGLQSSTTTAGPPPISRGPRSTTTSPTPPSASELVTELLQYIADPTDLMRAEAEALLAGIVLDTKNFSMRTGGRTLKRRPSCAGPGRTPPRSSVCSRTTWRAPSPNTPSSRTPRCTGRASRWP